MYFIYMDIIFRSNFFSVKYFQSNMFHVHYSFYANNGSTTKYWSLLF